MFLADDVLKVEVLRLLFSFGLFGLPDNLFFSVSAARLALFDGDIMVGSLEFPPLRDMEPVRGERGVPPIARLWAWGGRAITDPGVKLGAIGGMRASKSMDRPKLLIKKWELETTINTARNGTILGSNLRKNCEKNGKFSENV